MEISKISHIYQIEPPIRGFQKTGQSSFGRSEEIHEPNFYIV